MNTLEELKVHSPNCFSNFVLKSLKLPQLQLDELFVSKAVHCKCGHDAYSVLGHKEVEVKGFFRKRENVNILPPIYLECLNCGSVQLIFDPEKYGWDGINGDNANVVGKGKPVPLGFEGKVAILYSYQGLENYVDISSEFGRDMFDTFGLYIYNHNKLEPIINCECA